MTAKIKLNRFVHKATSNGFSLTYFVLLYFACLAQRGIVKLSYRKRRSLFGSLVDLNNWGWADHFVAMDPIDSLEVTFPTFWNTHYKKSFPISHSFCSCLSLMTYHPWAIYNISISSIHGHSLLPPDWRFFLMDREDPKCFYRY